MTATDEPEAARRRGPPRFPLAAAAAGLALLAAAAAAPAARAAIEDSYSPGEPPVSTTWFGPVSAEARRTDLEYVAGMRPHHAGALSMSREYLADPGRSSPLLQALARAIIANQTFEIGVLDEVARNLDRPPVRLPLGAALQPQATEGLAGAQRFFKEPIPGPLAHAVGPVSERDVQFAKAMIAHHEAAVEMARGYLAARDARNGYLGLMNVDIVTDQAQEIALMRRAIAAFPGAPDAVRVDPSMIHGMEGMRHGGGHGGHATAAAAAPPAQAGSGPAHDGGGGRAAHHHGRRAGRRHGGHDHHHHGHHGAHAAQGQHGGHHHAGHGADSAQGAAAAPTPGAGAARPRPQSRQAPHPRPAARQRPEAPAAGQGHHGHHH
jgi:uncharacterized protein (DUF305 family)